MRRRRSAAQGGFGEGGRAEDEAGDGGGEGGGPARADDAPAPAAAMPEDEHPVEEDVREAADAGGDAYEAGLALSGEVAGEDGLEDAEDAAELEDAVVGLLVVEDGGGVPGEVEEGVPEGNREEDERKGGEREPEALPVGRGGVALRAGAVELGDEGAGVAGGRDEQADEGPAEDAAGEGGLNGVVRVAREEDAVRELVDRMRAHRKHEGQRGREDVPDVAFFP